MSKSRFDRIETTLAEHSATLAEHTTRLECVEKTLVALQTQVDSLEKGTYQGFRDLFDFMNEKAEENKRLAEEVKRHNEMLHEILRNDIRAFSDGLKGHDRRITRLEEHAGF